MSTMTVLPSTHCTSQQDRDEGLLSLKSLHLVQHIIEPERKKSDLFPNKYYRVRNLKKMVKGGEFLYGSINFNFSSSL